MKRFWMACLLGSLFFITRPAGAAGLGSAAAVSETKPGSEEIEKYVRARIDLGETMRDFFRKRGGPPQFGGSEGPSMDELRKLEEEINTEVAKVLARHDLTIEEYQERSPDVFADKEGVDRFLASHPDLKKRYEALPPSPSRGRR